MSETMKNYTTQTAALKAVTIDTHLLDSNRINAKKFFLNGATIEDIIAANSSKGINNAVRISTTIGDILNGQFSDGSFVTTISSQGVLSVISDGLTNWQPIQIKIENNVIMVNWTFVDNGFSCELWESGDNWVELFGGLNENSQVDILVILHEQQDGNEPVRSELSGVVQHNIVYHLGVKSELDINLPSYLVSNYTAEIVFSSGSTPTTVTSDSRIKWVGDDIINGSFVPSANIRYSCTLQYDGVFVRGMVFGIPTI